MDLAWLKSEIRVEFVARQDDFRMEFLRFVVEVWLPHLAGVEKLPMSLGSAIARGLEHLRYF